MGQNRTFVDGGLSIPHLFGVGRWGNEIRTLHTAEAAELGQIPRDSFIDAVQCCIDFG